jgi:hypothetical protein
MKTKTLPIIILMFCVFAAFQAASAQGHFTYTVSAGPIVSGSTDLNLNTDDATATVALPFDYTFYGVTYSQVVVSSNGNIQFTGNTNSYNSGALPMAGFSDTIFAYQADLDTTDSSNGNGVFTSVSGSAPNRIFNIEWRTGFCCFAPGAPTENFEIRLYEGFEKFDIIYGAVTLSNGMTVGVQKDNLESTEVPTTDPGSVYEGLMLTFNNLGTTAADVSVSGMVVDPNGRGVKGAYVTLASASGFVKTGMTNMLGNFDIGGVPSGDTYIIQVRSKLYTYAPQLITLDDDWTDMVLTPTLQDKGTRATVGRRLP